MPRAALRAAARAVPVAALLLAVAACGDTSPTAPTHTSSSEQSQSQTSMGEAHTAPSDRSTAVNIRLTIDGHSVDAALNDSATARDFAALLPLTLNLTDFHQTERIADLPRKLDTSGAPDAAEPKAGDLTYYAPWGNLALFYRDGDSPSAGLVILGSLTDSGDIDRLATADRVRVEAVS